MTYFRDFAPYTYSSVADRGRLLCIGWLDPRHEFPTGDTAERFRAALLRLCAEQKTAQTRGFHQCGLPPCDRREPWPPISVAASGVEVLLGSAEIRVAAGEGAGFAAPDLIYHYVVEHGYKPPDQFIEAVCRDVVPLPE